MVHAMLRKCTTLCFDGLVWIAKLSKGIEKQDKTTWGNGGVLIGYIVSGNSTTITC